LAECILRSAAADQTSYEGLLASASEQIQFNSFDDDLKRGRVKCALPEPRALFGSMPD
jgi:hypothetical protein